MALVSIDIGAMEDLVSDLTSARDDLPLDVSTVKGRLDHVMLSTEPVSGVDFGAEIWAWMDDRVRDLARRLALARLIAGSTPGVPGVGVVEIDESYVSDLSEAKVDALADEVETMMEPSLSGEPRDIDPRLLEILAEHGHDPYFAKAVADRVPPGVLDAYLRELNSTRGYHVRTAEEATDFDTDYNALLNGLGLTYGLASQGEGDLEVPGMGEAWADHIEQAPPSSGTAQRLSLVISRGTFSTDLLGTVHERMVELEGDGGAEYWTPGDFVFDPDPAKSPGSNLVMDPFGALYQGMGNNPEALQQVFAEGETVTVETDDGPMEVDARLWETLRYRGMDEYAVTQLVTGLQSGLAAPPVEGSQAWQPGLVEDLEGAVAAIEREARIAEENKPPWWSQAGHLVLDVVGMLPLVGEPADLLHGLWYTAEGNYVDAGLSAAGAVPIVGWFSVGGKWVKRALTVDELATIERLADNGTDMSRLLPGGRLPTSADELADPANYGRDNFLTPAELRRFEDRPWLQNMVAGNRFDTYMAPTYQHNQVYLQAPGGSGYVRLDSYVPGDLIVSRKLTQLGSIETRQARAYIDELVTKYPDGATVADVPSTRASGLAGQRLEGEMVLQVPPQAGGTIPDEVAEYAFENNVRIVDVNGFDYTAHLYP
ncbi:hypothetical protein BJF86_06760 [Serinicoccus sp. CNJ-927]|uniref:hypothetical protein n=1 Tax=Serinicoccus sp. CNJ-927 TaxID=1904970 RepID=UPI0009691D7F|nr:hypothetical protein [Serinicoccus sp. CNJ-927]OLT39558.1 hypothetical protein BJF86_06760 [Serinicoccus sp. CNJ-927]